MTAEKHDSLNLAQLTAKAFKPSNAMVTIFKNRATDVISEEKKDYLGVNLVFGTSLLTYREVPQLEAGLAAKEAILGLQLRKRI